jgi:transglutaminase-like putative cysteine protease
MKLTLTHTLTCPLTSPSRMVTHLLLTPVSTPQQRVERWSIEMPGFSDAATFRDGFGNKAHLVSQSKPGETLVVKVTGAVETIDKAGVIGKLEYDPPAALFRRPTELTRPPETLLAGMPTAGGRIAMLHELMGRLHETVGAQQSQSGGGGQEQSLGTRDSVALAHAFIGAARALDIPARYVTGYLLDDGGEASVHAWAEACDEGLGWIGFDPLLNVCPAEQHIRLAAGLDAMGTMPIRMVPDWTDMPDETVEIVEG